MQRKSEQLKSLLERWHSHNEVHARPADSILYEFLKGLLENDDESEQEAPAPPQTSPPIMAADEEGPGGNNPPNAPDIP